MLWIFTVLSVPVTDLPAIAGAATDGLRLSGEISLGQIGVIVAVVWTAAKIYYPLLSRVKNLEDRGAEQKSNISRLMANQTTQSNMLQRLIGMAEGSEVGRSHPRPSFNEDRE